MRTLALSLALAVLAVALRSVHAEAPPPLPGTVVLSTKHGFDELVARTQRAIEASGMLLVCKASASAGAVARGIKIPGNAVLMVFRNDYALRMLEASVTAGVEAPLRLYITEAANGSATLSYRRPSAVFQPYDNRALDAMAAELDTVFEKIVHDAVDG